LLVGPPAHALTGPPLRQYCFSPGATNLTGVDLMGWSPEARTTTENWGQVQEKYPKYPPDPGCGTGQEGGSSTGTQHPWNPRWSLIPICPNALLDHGLCPHLATSSSSFKMGPAITIERTSDATPPGVVGLPTGRFARAARPLGV